MKLYGSRGMSSGVVEATLQLADLKYEYVDLTGFTKPGAAQDTLLKLNPLCQVPTLLCDSGVVMTESAAIILHVMDGAPHIAPPLGTPERETFLRLLVWFVATLLPTFTYGCDAPEKWAPSAPQELLETTTQRRQMLLKWLDSQVVGPYVVGKQVTPLDIYAVAFSNWEPNRDWLKDNTTKLLNSAHLSYEHPRLRRAFQDNGWIKI